jgi:hypothetical protein
LPIRARVDSLQRIRGLDDRDRRRQPLRVGGRRALNLPHDIHSCTTRPKAAKPWPSGCGGWVVAASKLERKDRKVRRDRGDEITVAIGR